MKDNKKKFGPYGHICSRCSMVFYGAEYLNKWIQEGKKKVGYTCEKCNEELGKLNEGGE